MSLVKLEKAETVPRSAPPESKVSLIPKKRMVWAEVSDDESDAKSAPSSQSVGHESGATRSSSVGGRESKGQATDEDGVGVGARALARVKHDLSVGRGVPLIPAVKGKMSTRGLHYRNKIYQGCQIVVNSAAAKYLQFINGSSTKITWNQVGSASEFTSLDAIFDEFYIRSVTLRYIPRNHYSAQSTASSSATGSPGDLNTCAATLVGLPHNGAAYADSSTAWVIMLAAQHKKFVDMGAPWIYKFANPEKFAWDGPLGDMATSNSTMMWCQNSNTSAYGGLFQLATPAASGAAIGIGTLLENGIFGDLIIEYDVCWRARA